MTKHLATLIAPTLFCQPGVLPAAGGGAAGQQGSATAAALAAERLRQAMVAPDRAALDALVADDLSYGHSSGKVGTKASFIADLLSGASDFVDITITDQTVQVTGPNAIVRHT